LYPFFDPRNIQQAEQELAPAALRLAQHWAAGCPETVSRRLARWEAEMTAAGQRVWPRWSRFVCQEISRLTHAPGAWFTALCESGAAADLIEPFLHRTVHMGEAGWADRLRECLDNPLLCGAAIAVVLTMGEPPDDLLALALDRSSGWAG